jgi:hypothetical protein
MENVERKLERRDNIFERIVPGFDISKRFGDGAHIGYICEGGECLVTSKSKRGKTNAVTFTG